MRRRPTAAAFARRDAIELRRRAPWVFINGMTNCLGCERCGAAVPIKSGVGLGVMLSEMDAFKDKHRDCKLPIARAA